MGTLFKDQRGKFGMEFPEVRTEIKKAVVVPQKVSSPKHSHDRRSSAVSEKAYSSSKSNRPLPQRRSVEEPCVLSDISDKLISDFNTGAIFVSYPVEMSDEAIIRLLAVTYKYDSPVMSGLDCCHHNRNAALNLGLLQRAAVWAAMEVLLPQVTSGTTSLPMSKKLLSNLLSELLDQGDCQSFVVCCEILRRELSLDSVPVSRLQEGYLAYIGKFLPHLLHPFYKLCRPAQPI